MSGKSSHSSKSLSFNGMESFDGTDNSAHPTNEIKETRYDFFFAKENPYADVVERLRKYHDLFKYGKTQKPVAEGSFLEKAYNIASNIIGGSDTGSNISVDKIRSFRKNIPKDEMRQAKQLLTQQKNSKTYKEWLNVSVKLDELLGNNEWKEDQESDLYDYEMVRNQLNEMRSAREQKDYRKMIYLIRTSWRRNFAGIDNVQLYQHCYVGTKKLIEDYLEECEHCLADLVSSACSLDDNYIMEMLIQTRKNYGRMAITMSGGGTFGLTGIGVFAALFENDIFPKMVSGSSCGSIMSAIVCSKHSGEVLKILQHLFEVQFEVFGNEEKPETGLSVLGRFLKYGVCFDNDRLKETIKNLLGDITFKEAYNKTGRILNITVSPASIHDQPTLLNYLTAPNVLIWSAICASCSLPLIFQPSTIYEKDFNTGKILEWSNPMVKFVDGSVNGDLPITRLSEMFNVNHVIACQANPHILPLVRFSMECDDHGARLTTGLVLKRILKWSFKAASFEVTHYMDIMNEVGFFPNVCTKVKQLFLQPYSGDITILPDIRLNNLSVLFANPTPDFIWDCIIWGARATWPQLRMIKDHCSIEFSLDKYIAFLKSRMITRASSKQKAKRPCTLLNCDNLPLEEQDFDGARNRREQRFRSRSETVSCYYFQSEQSTPKRKLSGSRGSFEGDTSLPLFESTPKLEKRATMLTYQQQSQSRPQTQPQPQTTPTKVIRRMYSSSAMPLRQVNAQAYQLPELVASSSNTSAKGRRHSSESNLRIPNQKYDDVLDY
ncbi:hypothetical protein FOA43_003779 [Brettanomyces nanus]|uniref:Patatin-like phospholipase domain-containing protein n=1 Tax=Eeniella nana TaxID=13502 RepID=A0A875RQB0_EENNA|nr:uncharacterized protein FOA43_003779 [Brettanomyces nanus]QPG76390.1 hypothetical protein FOA43_003779 [Brettanomyces nanus]